MEVVIGGVYRHFKGNTYKVLNFAKHSETGEKMVIYKALYGDGEIWARPYDSFVERVDKPNQTYRFELIDDAEC